MESITGTRPLFAAVTRARRRADRDGLLGGLALLATLVVLDAVLGESAAVAGTFILAPFVPAILGSVLATTAVGLLTVGAALASATWDMSFGSSGYWIRAAAMVLGSAFAIVAARGRQRARVSSERLATLDAVAAIADGSLPLSETLERVVEMIVPAAADMCMIDAIHEGRVVRAAVRVSGRPDAAEIEARLRTRTPSVPERFVTGERAWMDIAHFRRRMDAEDLRRMAQDPDDLAFLQSVRPRSSIVAALTARGRTLGTLTLATTWSGRHYATDDVRFAQVLSRRIGLALDSAGLFSDLESVERRLDAVMSILDEAVVVHDAAGDLVFANDAAAGWLGYATPQEALDASRSELLGRFELWSEAGERLGNELIAERFRAGRWPRRELVRIAFRDSAEERWGVVNSEPIEGPDGRMLYAVTTVDDVTELKRSEFAQQLLARTGELLASSIDYRETLDAAARVAVPQFADWCLVNVPDGSGALQQAAVAHSDPDAVAVADRMISPEALLDVTKHHGRPRLMPDDGRGSAIVAPMAAGAKVVGVLAFVNGPESRSFDDRDLSIAIEIARRTGLAIDNARLAEEHAEVARELQWGLRPPQIPAMRGFEVATLYRPAGEVNEVGGDFYEAFEIDGGWMAAIGDVMGRGAAAASLTALARYTIRTAGTLTGDPRRAAALVDQALKQGSDLALCSAVILVLPDTGDDPAEVRLLIAGHPPPLRVRDGRVEPVGASGPLLGAPDEPDWEIATVELELGDQLVLYTDGVTEARGEAERFGERRLHAVLGQTEDPAGTIRSVESALEMFLSGDSEDDAAMLTVRRSSWTPAVRELADPAKPARATTWSRG